VPAVYVLLALVASVVFAQWDENSPLDSPLELSSSSASTALAALGSGMLAFTGFVTSVVLLVIQFGSTQFSPRFLRWFRDDRTLKHALGTFVATFLFALAATALMGRGESDIVPYRTLMLALTLAVASVAWFLALVSHTMDNLRVAHVTQRVDAEARQAFDAVYPAGHSEVQAGLEAVAAIGSSAPIQELRHDRVGAVLVSIDRRGLVQEASLRERLAAGVVTGPQGEARLVYPTPSWDDLVALSRDEIRAFGPARTRSRGGYGPSSGTSSPTLRRTDIPLWSASAGSSTRPSSGSSRSLNGTMRWSPIRRALASAVTGAASPIGPGEPRLSGSIGNALFMPPTARDVRM
jgi:hypothetical protein